MLFNHLSKYIFAFFLVFITFHLNAQEALVQIVNEILEDQQGRTLSGLNGEELFNDLLKVYHQPILINAATKEQWEQLPFLSDYQVENLQYYVYTSGPMLTIYELKAVPGLDAKILRWLLPFVELDEVENKDNRRFLRNEILGRVTRIPELQKGFKLDSGNRFLGNPNAVLIRMDGTWSDKINWHFLNEKDRGEKDIYDFLSGGISYRNTGLLQKVMIGDYKVRTGQGLISWSGNGYGKNMEIDQIRRRGEVLSLYGSSRETGYFRGGAVSFGLKNLEWNLWASQIPIDASTGDLNDEEIIQSIYEDGLHNTPTKLANKHAAKLSSIGTNVRWNNRWFRHGFTYLYQPLDIPLVKITDESFAHIPQTDSWHNYSFDFFTSIRHVHFWGEMALQSHGSYAAIAGMNLFPHDAIQSTLVYRNYSSDFYSIYGSAFGESGNPTNETGLFFGLKIIPGAKLSVNTSVDIYRFPWLRYQQTFTSQGYETFLKAEFTMDRFNSVYIQLRYEERDKTVNTNQPMDAILPESRLSTRLNYLTKPAEGLTWLSRIEVCTYQLNGFDKGVLLVQDFGYQKSESPLAVNARFAWFNTTSYQSRLYAYERDVLYAFSVPAYYGNGIRTYLNLKYQPIKNLSFWLRFARTTYFDRETIGSGLDEIEANYRSEIKLQMRVKF